MRKIVQELEKKKKRFIKELEDVNIGKLKNQYSEMSYLWSSLVDTRNTEILKVVRALNGDAKDVKDKNAMEEYIKDVPLFEKMRKIDKILSKAHRVKEIDKAVKVMKKIIDGCDELN
jgi:hypothetical protein